MGDLCLHIGVLPSFVGKPPLTSEADEEQNAFSRQIYLLNGTLRYGWA
jgi:hypothetical protein